MFSYLTSRLIAQGRRVMLLAHRDELLEQISKTLAEFEVMHGVIAGGSDYFDPRLLAHVAGVFTVVRRLARLPVPDYVIVDEAHHCIADSTWGKVIAFWRAANPKLIVIGVTATPERLDGSGLGSMFDDMVLGPTTAELIERGRLSAYKLFAPPPREQVDLTGLHTRGGDFRRDEAAGAMDKPTITGNAVAHYRKHCNGAPAVAFCTSIEHAAHVAEAFQAQGFRAASIDGKLHKDERKRRVQDFGRGQLNVLVSCDLISEGFDVPGIVGALLLRPTQSLSLYLQQVGRALRTAPGKSHAVILDHVGNTDTHGLPDDEREWSLEGCKRKGKATRDPDDLPVKQCKHCYAINRALAQRCSECGQAFVVKARTVAEVEGELQEVDMEAMRQEQRRQQGQAKTVESMVHGLGYSAGRAQHILQAREEKHRLRNQALTLTADLQRATGEQRVSIGVIGSLKPKDLCMLIDAMLDKLWDAALAMNAERETEGEAA
jgi:superfamily II DNA or RNA helicase